MIFLWPSFHLFVASYRYLVLCESVLQLKTNFYDSCSYLSSLLFLLPNLNLFPVLHCALFSLSADRALLDCVIDRKVRDVIFEAILSPSERYQNIQDNPEYNSVLPFRIILKIFAVNMLFVYHLRQSLSNFNILSFFATLKSISNTKYLFVFSSNAGKYRRE